MNSSDYFKRGERTFPVILGILLGIRLASVFACIGEYNSFDGYELKTAVLQIFLNRILEDVNIVRKTEALAREVLGIIHMDIFKLPFLESVVNNVVFKKTLGRRKREFKISINRTKN